jgi:VIT1/CCC1 family predicted Fe2+/Mn2+ transporter
VQDHRAIDALLARLPANDPERATLQARAVAYSKDCGCTMGAAFFAGALLLAVTYLAVAGLELSSCGIAVAFVFLATVVGKLTGLLVASLKLTFLRRSLSGRLRSERYSAHVHLH